MINHAQHLTYLLAAASNQKTKLLEGNELLFKSLTLKPKFKTIYFNITASFMNGPVTGTDVFIPMDMIIGGQTRLGFGWNMLMVCSQRVLNMMST